MYKERMGRSILPIASGKHQEMPAPVRITVVFGLVRLLLEMYHVSETIFFGADARSDSHHTESSVALYPTLSYRSD